MNFDDLKALRAKEEQALQSTLLVDIADAFRTESYDMDRIRTTLQSIADTLELQLKYLDDLINPYTPAANRTKAKAAIRLSKKPHTIIIITDEAHPADNWVKTYSEKGIHTYVYHADTDIFYTAEEYSSDLSKELLLDNIMRLRHSDNRSYLEDLAESFSAALGWTFSGPIRESAATAIMLDKLKPYEILPSAGFKGNYGFPETVHSIGDTFMEDDIAPSGKTTVYISRKTIASTGRAVPVKELQAFNEYLTALIESNMFEDMLEEGWMLCSCGYPVRTSGFTHDDAYCPYCDAPIPNFEVFTFDALAYQGYLTYSRVNEK